MSCVPAGWAAVEEELSVVLNQHRLQWVSAALGTQSLLIQPSALETKAPRGAATNLKWPEWFVSAGCESKWRPRESSPFNNPVKPGFLWSTASLGSIELQISLSRSNRQTHTQTCMHIHRLHFSLGAVICLLPSLSLEIGEYLCRLLLESRLRWMLWCCTQYKHH